MAFRVCRRVIGADRVELVTGRETRQDERGRGYQQNEQQPLGGAPHAGSFGRSRPSNHRGGASGTAAIVSALQSSWGKSATGAGFRTRGEVATLTRGATK